MKKISLELFLSAIIVSFIETIVLYYLGFLKTNSIMKLGIVASIVSVIELALMFLIEELLIKTRNRITKDVSRA